MQFEISTETLSKILKIEYHINQSLGCSLDFNSEHLIADFFELCGLCEDRRIVLQADKIWACLIKENKDFDKSKQLNIYRARMQQTVKRREAQAA